MKHFCDLISSCIGEKTPNYAALNLPLVNESANLACQLALSQCDAKSAMVIVLINDQTYFLSTNKTSASSIALPETLKRLESQVKALNTASSYSFAKHIVIQGSPTTVAMPIGFGDIKCKTLLVLELYEAPQESTALEMSLEFICNGFVSTVKNRALLTEQQQIQELHQLILKHNRDWIFVKDRDFKLVYVNQAFLNLYPKEKHDRIIGFTTLEEYEQKDIDLFLAQDKVAFEHGYSHVQEDITMPDGSQRKIETTKRRFTDESGAEYILCIAHDITEQQQLIEGLKKANAELDEFANIASHDLKAPLNAIQRLLQWIEKDCENILPEGAKTNFSMVMQRAERMKRLLNDMLRYARLGRDAETLENCDFETFLNDALEFTDGSKKIELTANSGSILAPPTSLKTVLVNLVSNAVKHNDKQICVLDAHVSETRHYYKITIEDNGPGIAEKYHTRIFKLFQTLKTRDDMEGSGVGLSLVSKILMQLGGDISVESDGKLGTKFVIKWPKQSKNEDK